MDRLFALLTHSRWMCVGMIVLFGGGLAGCDSGGTSSAPPEVTGVEPTSAQPSTVVTIFGSNFGSDASEVTVVFGDASASIQSVSPTEIDAEVPEDATAGLIEVTVGEKTAVGPTFDPIPKGRIVFDRGSSDGSGSEFHTMKPDGSDLEQITDDGEIKSDPDWSPDGDRVVFNSFPDGVFTIRSDGADRVLVTDNTTIATSPSWSPDGARVAFDAPDGNGDSDIRTVDPDGTNPEAVTTSSTFDRAPAWSPDGSQLAFVSDRGDEDFEMYMINADGSSLEQITDNLGDDSNPAWSPDGSRIAFSSDRTGNNEIYTMNPDGSDLRQVTNNSAADGSPAWSLDGSRLVFHSDRDGNFEIYTIGPDGSNLTRITNNSADDFSPDWGASFSQ